MYLEPRNGLWYVRVPIPDDVRDAFGGKRRFLKSLQTSSKQVAQYRALPFISKWKAAIRQARGETDSLIREALMWRNDIATQKDPDTVDVVEDLIASRAEELESKVGYEKALEFHEIATGKATLLRPLYDEWKGQLDLAPKTMDQMGRDVEKLVKHFVVLEKIAPKS